MFPVYATDAVGEIPFFVEVTCYSLTFLCEAAKTKWRGLRDTFRKELSKNPKKRSGDEGGIIKESRWVHFKSMEFLKDQFQKRQLQGNVSSETTFDVDTQNSTTTFSPDPDDPDDPDNENLMIKSPQNTPNTTTPPQNLSASQKKVAKMNNANAVKQLMILEEQKLQFFKEKNSASRNEDLDYHFLMSLLPYLRKIPEERKMFVRIKLQQVFCEEDILGEFRGQHTLQPTHRPPPSVLSCSSSTSGSWISQVGTPLSTTQHEDLASFFSSVTP
ncbi:uncharacterized protein LOC113555989 [Rhopalosiphum maidis]|uniref:uncharacterized protein LOC113555989 n=1 Tax=Rhopalosiphum maidis TaxID=43146 RepID=UPI000EFDF3F8|nr:uncharacterized protein LOC113555989 [Rhopalosiphum maidis]